MKNLLEKIKSFFTSLGGKFKRKPKEVLAVNEPPTKPRGQVEKRKVDRFTILSWAVTLVIVVSLLGSTIFYKSTQANAAPIMVHRPRQTIQVLVNLRVGCQFSGRVEAEFCPSSANCS